jgi:hypothetical protein
MPKQKNQNKKSVTPVSEWKGKKTAEPLDLPSGNTCLVQVVGAQAFLRAGAIPNSLLPMVTGALEEAQKGKKSTLDPNKIMEEVAKDPEKLAEIFGMADAVTVMTVIEPRVQPVPVADESGVVPERDPDTLYVDDVDDEDKFFIMQFAMGGSRDLERFRNELAANVDALESSDDVVDDPQQALGV